MNNVFANWSDRVGSELDLFIQWNKIINVKLDLQSVDMKLLESLGFKIVEKMLRNNYYYDIEIPNNYMIQTIWNSQFNNYFHNNRWSKNREDFIILEGNNNVFSILWGVLTKWIDDIKIDIEDRDKRMQEEIKENVRKEAQKIYWENICSTLEFWSYRKEKIELKENWWFLPAVFISEQFIEKIKFLEWKWFKISKTKKYDDLYDITVPDNFIIEESDYHLSIKGVCDFYYKKDLWEIINLDLQIDLF